ncbi:MAG: S-methyl-5-thioribose-1-phosphate isomerase [Syntrophomonadaceae bacterium]|jgi:methylthioribose-1-phosphate isomerase
MIRNIYWDNNAVYILDQTRLPHEIVYEKCETPEQVADAIRLLKVRGAPLIGVTAAFGVAVAMARYGGPQDKMDDYIKRVSALLKATRPTAVNLQWALDRMAMVYSQNAEKSCEDISQSLIDEAHALIKEDVTNNKKIGEYGQDLFSESDQVLTICNAGALATGGYGTALGVIRSAVSRKKIKKIWVSETRPVLQGARLTVWELLQEKMPVTLITDNMAGHLMRIGCIDKVIVGADRIAMNGDVANKIGTYSLAVLARHHGIPFYVAAPLSTFDWTIKSGQDIPIEERNPEEIRKIGDVYLTVPDVTVYNPAFDITPGDLITAIITEEGLLNPPYTASIELMRRKREE